MVLPQINNLAPLEDSKFLALSTEAEKEGVDVSYIARAIVIEGAQSLEEINIAIKTLKMTDLLLGTN